MFVNSALAASPAVEGALVLGPDNPACSLVSPVAAGLRAGPGGVALGRFGWAGLDGVVRNARAAATDLLGLVVPDIPPNSDWRNVFYDDVTCTWRVREGLPVTMMSKGKFWVRFPGGAYPFAPVYANLLDGSAISGQSLAGELTPWSVATPAAADGLAIITSWGNTV